MGKTSAAVGLVAAVATAMVGPRQAYADCEHYTIQVIHAAPCGILGIPTTVGLDINEHGWICGYHRNCNADDRAFVWFGGAIVTIPGLPTKPDGHAESINDVGQVVGRMFNTASGGGKVAFLYDGGVVSALPAFPTQFPTAEAYSINDNGMIVGSSFQSGSGTGAVRWETGSLVQLLPDRLPFNQANDVNNSSEVTGYLSGSDTFGFIWSPKGFSILDPIPGGYTSEGMAINNHGDVAVRGRIATGPGPADWITRSFVYKNGKMIDIGTLPSYLRTHIEDINDAGQAVGFCTDLPVPSVPPAFIWQNGVMKSLAELCPGAPINITRAYAINNKGQITGSGINPQNRTVAYVLSPPKRSPGDFNCDGIINVDDLVGLLSEWGPAIPGMHTDFNNDGLINVDDLVMLLGNWSS